MVRTRAGSAIAHLRLAAGEFNPAGILWRGVLGDLLRLSHNADDLLALAFPDFRREFSDELCFWFPSLRAAQAIDRLQHRGIAHVRVDLSYHLSGGMTEDLQQHMFRLGFCETAGTVMPKVIKPEVADVRGRQHFSPGRFKSGLMPQRVERVPVDAKGEQIVLW